MANKTQEAELDKPEYFEATLSVLGYQVDAEWVALALEMDLRGYGETWEAALDELRELVLMQISFAHFQGHPEMIWKDAERKFWKRFREVQRAEISQALAATPGEQQVRFHAGGLAIPPPHVIAAQKTRFLPANG